MRKFDKNNEMHMRLLGRALGSGKINEVNGVDVLRVPILDLSDSIQPLKPVVKVPPAAKTKPIPDELYMGWDALDKSGKLEKIKQQNTTLFCVLFFEKFGQMPNNYPSYNVDTSVKLLYQKALRDKKITTLSGMSWPELMAANMTTELQNIAPDIYREKFYNYYKAYPKTEG